MIEPREFGNVQLENPSARRCGITPDSQREFRWPISVMMAVALSQTIPMPESHMSGTLRQEKRSRLCPIREYEVPASVRKENGSRRPAATSRHDYGTPIPLRLLCLPFNIRTS